MSINVPLILIFLFILKHLVCDFFLQRNPYQFLNKGTFGHPGGLLHAGINGIGTMITLALILPVLPFTALLAFGAVEFTTHYFIDFAKVNINNKMGWKPESSGEYWISLGIDQALHWMIYLLIIFVAIAKTDVIALLIICIILSFIGCLFVIAATSDKRSRDTGIK
jgi:hypothetical protein